MDEFCKESKIWAIIYIIIMFSCGLHYAITAERLSLILTIFSSTLFIVYFGEIKRLCG